MTTKSKSASMEFRKEYGKLFQKVSKALFGSVSVLHVALQDFDFENDVYSVRAMPMSSTFNLSVLGSVMDDLSSVFSSELDADVAFDADSVELAMEGFDEYTEVYFKCHFKVKKWTEFDKVKRLHLKVLEEKEIQRSKEREAQRVRDEANKKKAEEKERKLYEKLKKKYGDK